MLDKIVNFVNCDNNFIITLVIVDYCTVEPPYCGHHWGRLKCPCKRGIVSYTKATFGTPEIVLFNNES